MLRLTNKIAVITDGGSGIGQAIAELSARQGASVQIIEQDSAAAQTVALGTTSLEGLAYAHTCDVSQQASVLKIKHIDIVVNNAGITHVGRLDATPEFDFDCVLSVIVKRMHNCLCADVPLLQRRGGGVILNMSSIATLVGLLDCFAYSMSKGALQVMTL